MKIILATLLLSSIFFLGLTEKIELVKSTGLPTNDQSSTMFHDHENYYASFYLTSPNNKKLSCYLRLDTSNFDIWAPSDSVPVDDTDDRSAVPISFQYFGNRLGGYTYTRKISSDDLGLPATDCTLTSIKYNEMSMNPYYGSIGLGYNVKDKKKNIFDIAKGDNSVFALDLNEKSTSYLYLGKGSYPFTNLLPLAINAGAIDWTVTLSSVSGLGTLITVKQPITFSLNYRSTILDQNIYDAIIGDANSVFNKVCEKINNKWYCNCVDYMDAFPRFLLQFTEGGDNAVITVLPENYFNILSNGYCELAIEPKAAGGQQIIGEKLMQHMGVVFDSSTHTVSIGEKN